MKNIVLLLILIISASLNLSAQQISAEWNLVNNGDSTFGGWGKNIICANDGYIYVAGESGYDIFITKYNSSGNVIWTKYYNTPTNLVKQFCQMIIENNYIYILGSVNYSNILFIKYDTNGTFLWDAVYDEPEDMEAIKLFIKNGEVYITGEIEDAADINHSADIIIRKYDFNGNLSWTARYGNAWHKSDKVTDIFVDSQNNVYVSGHSERTSPGHFYSIITLKYNANGTFVWLKYFENPYCTCFDLYNQGSLFVDNLKNTYIYSSITINQQNFTRYPITLKYDSLGNLSWYKIDTTENIINPLSWSRIKFYVDSTGTVHVQDILKSDYTDIQKSVFYIKYDSQGNRIYYNKWVSNSFSSGFIYDFRIDDKNNAYLIGLNEKPIENGWLDSYRTIEKVNSNNQQIWINNQDYNYTYELWTTIDIDSNKNIYTLGLTEGAELMLVSKYCGYCNSVIKGTVFNDINGNCIKEQNETGLSGILLKTEPLVRYATTDSIGNFAFLVDTGSYVVKEILPNNYWEQNCPSGLQYSVNLTTSQDTTIDLMFGNQIVTYCPLLTVDLSTFRLRRCDANNYYDINYCNEGTATANNVYITINFDANIIPLSSTLPWTSSNGNLYTFNIGTLNPNDCGSFRITDSISCNANLGLTICTEARIYPDTTCETINPLWDKSSISVTGKCMGDSLICFVIKNTGQSGNGDMSGNSTIRVYEDNYLIETLTFQLAGGDSLVKCYTANGKTIRLEADQRPYHTGNSHPRASVESCGNSSNPSLGYITSVPEDDADRNVEIDCQQIIGSYDPNEKIVKPEGITTNKFVNPLDLLEYQINFQNTGTDTAFLVVVRDTLSQYLDITTVQNGMSSHPSTFKIYGTGILEWTFKNILLADSNINEPSSHGYVRFSVSQKPNNPDGTIIKNSAGIYFDYNEPVITNQTINIVNDTTLVHFYISTTNKIICEGGQTNLMAVRDSLVIGTWHWYSSLCGGVYIGSATSILLSPTVTTTYFVRAEGTSNTTNCVSVTITVNTLSIIPILAYASPSVICSGSTTNLNVYGGSLGNGSNWHWYSGSCGGTSVGVGSPLSVNPTVATTYYVRAEGACNTTACKNRTVTIKASSLAPTSATASATTICGSSSSTLSVVGGTLGYLANWKWFSSSCGGTNAGAGSSITVHPTITTTYYVRAQGACNATSCASITISTGGTSIAAIGVTASSSNICEGSSTTLSAYNGTLGAGASWTWYEGTCGGTSIGVGTTFVASPTTQTTYYVRAEGGCNTTACKNKTINVKTNSHLPLSITASPATICSGSTVTLQVNGGSLGTGANWKWHTVSCGGTNAGAGTTITVHPTITTEYFVRAAGGCNQTLCATITVTVNTLSVLPASISASPSTFVSGASTTLNVNGGSLGTGADWYWFTGSCGGTSVGVGVPVTVSPIVSTLYFLRAEGICNTTACRVLTTTIKSGESEESNESISSVENIVNNMLLYPNPANNVVNINYSIAKDMDVKIALYNIFGAKVIDVVNQPLYKGDYSSELNLSTLPSGVYMCKMTIDGNVIVKRLVISR